MLSIILFLITVTAALGHANKMDDADLQQSLMPQELNPAFVSDKDGPWKMVMPLAQRSRRSNSEENTSFTSVGEKVRSYRTSNQTEVAREWPQSEDNRSSMHLDMPVALTTDKTIGGGTTGLMYISRVVAAVVMVVSAIIEVVVYLLESYQV